MAAWHSLFSESQEAVAQDVADLVRLDRASEQRSINLIASAAYCPRATAAFELSHLLNRIVPGPAGRRSVSSSQSIEAIEQMATSRARTLFDAESANVQPLSATVANVAVFRGLLNSGDSVLAFDPVAGGHVSHGGSGSAAQRDYRVHTFGTRESDGLIDVGEVRDQARRIRPRMIVVGATSYPRQIDYKSLSEIAIETEALFFADIAHVSGLIAAWLHENPVPYADVATSSTHKTLCGPRTGGLILCKDRIAEKISKALYPGLQGPAAAHIIAARAVLFDLVGRLEFRQLMSSVLENANALAQGLQEAGVPLYTDGTDTHMVVADLRGPAIDHVDPLDYLAAYGIRANVVSLPARAGASGGRGIRFGTTAMTIRGLDGAQANEIGKLVGRLLATAPRSAVDSGISSRLAEIAEACAIPS
ncbi:MAG: serine hydroxymethyltransferase [Reyranellaceae bacterium]